MVKFVKERIEDDLFCDELFLWFVCIFFRIIIYIFCVCDFKILIESFWIEYIKVRSRNLDLIKMLYFKKCFKINMYVIILLEIESNYYYRIVLK